jgi:TatD family-associated radical SAM protein
MATIDPRPEPATHAPPHQVTGYTLGLGRYLNVTTRCTLRCAFCPKFNGSRRLGAYDLRLEHEPSVQEMVEAVGDPCAFSEVVFCGFGEPTLRLPEVLEVARRLKQAGCARVRLNTDGLASLVHGCDVTPGLRGCIDALSISLNAQDEATYVRHCRPTRPGAYPALLDFAARARAVVPEVTLSALEGLDGVDIAACEQVAHGLGVRFRRRVLGLLG